MSTIVLSDHLPLTALFLVEKPSRLSIPIANDKIPAGFPSPAEPYATGYLDFNEYLITNPAATISVYCGGESMRDAGIDKDDLLIIDRSVTVLVKPRRTLLSENFHTPMDSFHCWLYEAV